MGLTLKAEKALPPLLPTLPPQTEERQPDTSNGPSAAPRNSAGDKGKDEWKGGSEEARQSPEAAGQCQQA